MGCGVTDTYGSVENRGILSRATRHRRVFGGAILLVLLAMAVLGAAAIAPHDQRDIDLGNRLRPPSREFPMGTDQLGRCVLSRTLYGGRMSLGAGLAATVFSLVVGAAVGLLSGLSAGWIDVVIMRGVDVVLAFPMLILALVVTAILGPSLESTVFGMSLAAWAWWARFVRGMVISARERAFVLGGRVVGVRGARLVIHYILPQVLPAILVAATLNTGTMIVAVSGLSFLGLGAQPPLAEWGAMLKEARMFFTRAPWMMMAPGMGVILSVLAFNLMGEGLRDALQVRRSVRF